MIANKDRIKERIKQSPRAEKPKPSWWDNPDPLGMAAFALRNRHKRKKR